MALVCAGVALGVLATAGGSCDGVSPSLSDLRLVGQAPDNPAVMLLELDFSDPTGDLGEGSMDTFLEGQLAGPPLLLLPIFLDSEVPKEATRGTLRFALELTLPADRSAWPDPGTRFRLGVRVKDRAGNESTTVEQVLVLDH